MEKREETISEREKVMARKDSTNSKLMRDMAKKDNTINEKKVAEEKHAERLQRISEYLNIFECQIYYSFLILLFI